MSPWTTALLFWACQGPGPEDSGGTDTPTDTIMDLDQDGWDSPEDCDDHDPQVNPGAAETWYDGVDQDCDGADDFDADSDNWVVSDDCDDTDPQVHPDAVETWYDGIDQDCDGLDDHDADQDGSPVDEDCDDQDPTRSPLEDEVPYDGIDQDCDGLDDDDDIDGDGYGLAEDCNDELPHVYPGAPEWCDELDHDCNGDPLEDGVCGEVQEPYDMFTTTLWSDDPDGNFVTSRAAMAGDLDGDGLSELLGTCYFCINSDGEEGVSAYAVPGGVEGWNLLRRDVEVLRVETYPWFHQGFSFLGGPLGDFNGDGRADLPLFSVGDSEFTGDSGWVGIITEPLAQLGGVVPLDDATAIEWETWEPDNWGIYPAAGDFNGDGLADLVVGTNNPESNGESKAVLLFGRTEAEGSLSPEDEPTILAEDPAFDNFTTLTNPGDLDGDGLDELLVSQIVYPHSVYLVRGVDLGVTERESIVDIASETWWVSDGAMHCIGSMGDIDGDGLDDWLLGTRYYPEDSYDYEGALYLVTEPIAGQAGDGTIHSAPGDSVGNYLVGSSAGKYLGSNCRILDFDGDGGSDVLAFHTSPDYESAYMVLPGRDLLSGPAAEAQDRLYLAYRSVLNAGDYDGDGDDDLLVQYWDEELYPAGFSGVGILPGWDVPWDDPDFW